MNITVNSNNHSKRCLNPNFTAQLKGSAVKMAVKQAVDGFQVGEVGEILDNVSRFGDRTTVIDCGSDGFVSVFNDKLSKLVYKFKLSKNEKSQNPFLDLLRNFNSENSILKAEYSLANHIFEHTPDKAKAAKYKFYSNQPVSVTTKFAIDAAARHNKIIEDPELHGKTGQQIKEQLNNLKELFLKNLEEKGI